MRIFYEVFAIPENSQSVVTSACWGHCCVNGSYGNTEW